MEQNSSTVDKEEIIGTMAKDLSLEKVEPKGEHYSEFETLYESVLFKKPELLTIKVFANAMDELKAMREKINEPTLDSELFAIDELMTKLYTRVHLRFAQLEKDALAKLLINVKDKLQSKKPQETVKKIGKMIVEYTNSIKRVEDK